MEVEKGEGGRDDNKPRLSASLLARLQNALVTDDVYGVVVMEGVRGDKGARKRERKGGEAYGFRKMGTQDLAYTSGNSMTWQLSVLPKFRTQLIVIVNFSLPQLSYSHR